VQLTSPNSVSVEFVGLGVVRIAQCAPSQRSMSRRSSLLPKFVECPTAKQSVVLGQAAFVRIPLLA
jgi:hypothetical protein